MVTIAAAVMAIGYTLFYVGGSNLAHGPGKGVGFTEALGLNGVAGPPSTSTPATSAKRATAPAASKPGTGGSKAKP